WALWLFSFFYFKIEDSTKSIRNFEFKVRNKNEKLIKRVTGAFSLILLVTLIFKIFQLPGGMILSGAFLGGMILGFVIILSLLLSLILKSIFKNIPFFSLLFIVSSIGFLILHYQFYSPTLKIIVPNGYKGDIHLVLSNVEENILKVDEYGIGYINEWTFNKTYARPKVIQENGKDLGNYLIGFNPSNFWGKSIGPENSIRSISFEISSDEYSNEKKYQSLDWLGFVNKNLVLRENPSKGIESNNAIEVKIAQAEDYNTVYQSENLIIEKLSENVYQHISFLQTNDFGKVDCNGMIVVNQNEAI